MQPVREQTERIDISPNGFNTSFPRIPDPASQMKKLKISEFISWSVCFSIICALTGLLMYLKVGVTMETITSGLFFLSLTGLVYSVSRLVNLTKKPARAGNSSFHELN